MIRKRVCWFTLVCFIFQYVFINNLFVLLLCLIYLFHRPYPLNAAVQSITEHGLIAYNKFGRHLISKINVISVSFTSCACKHRTKYIIIRNIPLESKLFFPIFKRQRISKIIPITFIILYGQLPGGILRFGLELM